MVRSPADARLNEVDDFLFGQLAPAPPGTNNLFEPLVSFGCVVPKLSKLHVNELRG